LFYIREVSKQTWISKQRFLLVLLLLVAAGEAAAAAAAKDPRAVV
jgi:hypothetical protein